MRKNNKNESAPHAAHCACMEQTTSSQYRTSRLLKPRVLSLNGGFSPDTPHFSQLVARAFLPHDGRLDDVARQVRREQLDELVGVAAQVGAALDAQARGARLEPVARVDGAQRTVARRVERHLGEDADAQAE